MEKYKDIVKFFSNKRTKCPKSVYVRGRDIFCGKFVRNGPNSRKTFTYMVGDNFFYGNFVKNEPNGKKVSDYIEEALK